MDMIPSLVFPAYVRRTGDSLQVERVISLTADSQARSIAGCAFRAWLSVNRGVVPPTEENWIEFLSLCLKEGYRFGYNFDHSGFTVKIWDPLVQRQHEGKKNHKTNNKKKRR